MKVVLRELRDRGRTALRRGVRFLVGIPGLVVIGHYSLVPVALIAVAMRVVLVLTHSYMLTYAVGAPGLPLLLAMIAHGSGICSRGRCAVLISAEPTREARRQRWWLHHAHHQITSVLTWSLVITWFVITYVLVWTIVSAVPVVAVLALEIHALQVHNRLRPWCPECNGRGPGDDPTPEPPPPGGLGRRVPRRIHL